MKTTRFLLVALLSVTTGALQAQTKSVALPPAAYANTRSVEIASVTLSDTATVLDVEAFYTPGNWVRIVSDSYLQADGKKFMIRSGEGIDLDSLFWMPPSGEASFKLVFEPLPQNTKAFDFIESDCESCFKIWGIDLVNKRFPLPDISANFAKQHEHEADFQTKWEKGDATVSGKIWGYVPGTLDWTLNYSNPITGNDKAIPVEIDNEGLFKVKVPIYSPTNLFLASRAAYIPIKVAPGKESSVIVNLPEFYREGSRLLKEQLPYGRKYYYAGYLARLNNDLANKNIIQAVQLDYRDSIADMDANGYKAFLTDKYNESVAHNDALDISPLAKKITEAMDAFALLNKLDFADYYLMDAYAKKHHLSRDEAERVYKPAKRAKDFIDCYQLIPYNEPEILLIPHIANSIRSLGYARQDVSDPFEVIRYLSQHEKVSEEDRRFFSDYLSAQEKKEEFKEAASIETVFNQYRSLADEYVKNQMGVGYLSQIWHTEEALLFDLINAQTLSLGLQDFNPLTAAQKQELSGYPEIIRQALLEENEVLLAKIEENKKKTGFTVLNAPTNVDEELFVEMLEPFKGKVILVDVWATWCGPCRMANKEMEPLKAQLADNKDLVFLYLAGENSPENTWKNMIADLKGEHYRVNQKQWDYLSESLNARGVPTYLIIDKEGNHSFHSVGFPGADTMKRELMKALNK